MKLLPSSIRKSKPREGGFADGGAATRSDGRERQAKAPLGGSSLTAEQLRDLRVLLQRGESELRNALRRGR